MLQTARHPSSRYPLEVEYSIWTSVFVDSKRPQRNTFLLSCDLFNDLFTVRQVDLDLSPEMRGDFKRPSLLSWP